MTVNEALQKLLHDQQLVGIFVLVGADLVLGVLAALYLGLKNKVEGFKFGRLVDFLQDDVLGKVLPWAGIYVFSQMYTGLAVLGVDLESIATGIWVAMLAALVASLTTTLGDLGLPIGNIPVLGKALSRPT